MRKPDGEPSGGALGPTALRLILGKQLHTLREAAGVSTDDAAYEIRASRSKISRMENGRVAFKGRDVEDLLRLYRVSDGETRSRLLSLVRQANAPGWWAHYNDVLPEWFEEYLGLESAASVIRTFELQFVYGLFQTEEYARAVTLLGHASAPPEEVDRRVGLRMKRQLLLDSPHAPRIWSVLDEGVLRRPVGGREVLRAQLVRLAEIASMPRVTLQVMPFSRGGHAAASGAFSVLRFREVEVPDVVFAEQLTSALYLDKRQDVDHYMEVMDLLSAKAFTPAETRAFLAEVLREALGALSRPDPSRQGPGCHSRRRVSAIAMPAAMATFNDPTRLGCGM